MTILHDCGCFSWAREQPHSGLHMPISAVNSPFLVYWRCTLHRGQTEADRQADAEQQAVEALAMNDWIDVRR